MLSKLFGTKNIGMFPEKWSFRGFFSAQNGSVILMVTVSGLITMEWESLAASKTIVKTSIENTTCYGEHW